MHTEEGIRHLPERWQKAKFRSTVEHIRVTTNKCTQPKLRAALPDTLLAQWDKYVEDTPNVPMSQRIYLFSGHKPGKCLQCGKPTKYIGTFYVEHCSLQCGAKTMQQKSKKTCMARYGVQHAQSLPAVRKKIARARQAAHRRNGIDWNARKHRYAEAINFDDTVLDPERRYYVYALMDTRKPGAHRYGKWKFDYEPFYIGKGKGSRAHTHILHDRSSNHHKRNKIAKIVRETGEYPVVCFKRVGLTERQALELEMKLIYSIGRSDLKQGPLTNLTDGGQGVSGKVWTKKQRRKMSATMNLAKQN